MLGADASCALVSRGSALQRQECKKRAGEAGEPNERPSWKYLKGRVVSPLEQARDELWHKFKKTCKCFVYCGMAARPLECPGKKHQDGPPKFLLMG
jgi:hypothetical protein